MWNVHDYYERIENESLSLSERFLDDGYVLTLWWGVDGLKMDDRGHYEWIKRKREKPIYGISTEEAIKAFSKLANSSGLSYVRAEQYNEFRR